MQALHAVKEAEVEQLDKTLTTQPRRITLFDLIAEKERRHKAGSPPPVPPRPTRKSTGTEVLQHRDSDCGSSAEDDIRRSLSKDTEVVGASLAEKRSLFAYPTAPQRITLKVTPSSSSSDFDGPKTVSSMQRSVTPDFPSTASGIEARIS